MFKMFKYTLMTTAASLPAMGSALADAGHTVATADLFHRAFAHGDPALILALGSVALVVFAYRRMKADKAESKVSKDHSRDPR